MHGPRRWEGHQSPPGGPLQYLSSARSGCYVVLTAVLLLVGVCFVWSPRPDAPQLRACITPAATETTIAAAAPAVLAKMLVMVTFFWDINHLSFLTQVRTIALCWTCILLSTVP